jgi:murein DD-endopeptidase MepM/ murein hydrolase activator NlpD
MPELDVWQLAADFRMCDDRGKVCLAINAVTPERSLVRVENKLIDDVTWTWSFDCINSEFRDDQTDRPVVPPYTIVVQGRHLSLPPEASFDSQPVVLGSFVVTDPTKPFRQNWHYSFVNANTFATHDSQMRYTLPFRVEPGATPVSVTQVGGGTFSHQGKSAYDFAMPEGTDVVAMRAGIVSSVTMDNFLSKFAKGVCPEPVTIDCKTPGSEANSVVVLHDDGTYAQYAHLQQNSAAVQVGDYVRSGALLAKSGNTGFSTNPHLHVNVFVRGHESSVPITFRDPALPAPTCDTTEVPTGWSRFLNKYTGQLLFVKDGTNHEEATTPTRPFAERLEAAETARVLRLQEPVTVLTSTMFEPAKGTLILERGMKWNQQAAEGQTNK